MYSTAVQEHFTKPRRAGSLENPDAVGQAGTPGQGPYIVFGLRVTGHRITDARFLTYGCPAAIACGSFVAEHVVGRTRAEAYRLTAEDIDRGLGGLPLGKEHCPALAK
jgi:NifU-like protein involved in Fe-S cluster formation